MSDVRDTLDDLVDSLSDGDTDGVPGLMCVRRRDLRALECAGTRPAYPVGLRHGGRDDPRYPSPRKLRRVLAFLVDFLVHIGSGAGVAYLVSTHLAMPLGTALVSARSSPSACRSCTASCCSGRCGAPRSARR